MALITLKIQHMYEYIVLRRLVKDKWILIDNLETFSKFAIML